MKLLLCLVSKSSDIWECKREEVIVYMRDFILHPSFAYCVILRTINFVSTTIYFSSFLTNLNLRFPVELFGRNKTFAAPNGEFERFGGFPLTVYTTRCKKESRVESSFSTAPEI